MASLHLLPIMEYSREHTSDQQGTRPVPEPRRGSILRLPDPHSPPRSKKVSFADDDSKSLQVVHDVEQLATHPAALIPGQSKCCTLW